MTSKVIGWMALHFGTVLLLGTLFPRRRSPSESLPVGQAEPVEQAERLEPVQPVEPAEPAIEIVLGTGPSFDVYRNSLYHRAHTIRVGLRNRSRAIRLEHGELIVEDISSDLAKYCPVKVRSGLGINPGATEYVDLVTFEDEQLTASGRPSPPYRVRTHFPFGPLGASTLTLVPHQFYELRLLATAAGSAPNTLQCRLSVEDGILKLDSR